VAGKEYHDVEGAADHVRAVVSKVLRHEWIVEGTRSRAVDERRNGPACENAIAAMVMYRRRRCRRRRHRR
jgi:hypothetical protein